MSFLRLLGLFVGAVSLLFLLWQRRQGRLLGRVESLGLLGAVALLVVAVHPGVADGLVALTGFEGALSRITSLLAFSVVGLFGWALFLQGQLSETRLRLLQLLRNEAVAREAEHLSAVGPVDVALVMPAFNEAENLAVVLRALPREVSGRTVHAIVVDDGSDDDTARVAREAGATAIRTSINVGGGHALQVGFLAARRLGARWVVTLDADGQHRFEDLPVVVAPLLGGEADVVIGSRNLGKSVGHETTRALGLAAFNTLLSVVVGRRISDCSSGYRGFDLGKLSKLRLVQDRHHTAELIIEASRNGLRIVEVPITILPRHAGQSKKGPNWRYGLRFARTVAASWWG